MAVKRNIWIFLYKYLHSGLDEHKWNQILHIKFYHIIGPFIVYNSENKLTLLCFRKKKIYLYEKNNCNLRIKIIIILTITVIKKKKIRNMLYFASKIMINKNCTNKELKMCILFWVPFLFCSMATKKLITQHI